MDKYCCDKDLSFELYKRGIFTAETLNIWVKKIYPNGDIMRYELLPQKYHDDYFGMYEMFSAPTSEELLEKMPAYIGSKAYGQLRIKKVLIIGESDYGYCVVYEGLRSNTGMKLSNVLAKMIVWIYDNNLVDVKGENN